MKFLSISNAKALYQTNVVAKVLRLRRMTPRRLQLPKEREVHRLRTENARYKALLNTSPTGHFTLDSNLLVAESNQAGAELLNTTPKQLHRKSFPDLIVARDRQFVLTQLAAVTDSKTTTINTTLLAADQPVPALLHLTSVASPAGHNLYCQVSIENLSKQNETQHSLRLARDGLYHVVNHDPLTRLPNRSGLSDKLVQALKTNKRCVALVLLDLDDFKQINDPLGHQFGDDVLREVADRLVACVKRTDTVGRIGGDEFALILQDITAVSEVQTVVAEVREQLSQGHYCGSYDVPISATIGVSLFPDHASSATQLLSNAGAAMNRAKAIGKNSVQFYTEDVNTRLTERFKLAYDLRTAVRKSQFELYFQAQHDITSNSISGYEVLVRWNHPVYGVVGPQAFIEMAEETGLIESLGDWILAEACKKLVTLRATGKPVKLCVNVSAKQLNNGNLHQSVVQLLASNGLPASALELELTESALLENGDQSINMLHELRNTGVELAIDDFGTGYSSFSRLQQLPVSRVKIDRSFVQDIPDNPGNCSIAKAIISVAHDLGMGVVAEGVETHQQALFLSAAGCDILQGYYIGRPVPFHQIAPVHAADDHRLRKPELATEA